MITKNISIRDDQQDWIIKRSLSLSRFVQRRLDEEMERSYNEKPKTD